MAEGRKLASAVHIDGKWYRAGDTLTEDVAAKVRNPKVFAADDDQADGTTPTEPGTPTGARLAARVQVGGKWYGPDDAVPDDVAAQIRNPKAWADGKVPDGAAEVTAPTGTDAGDAGNVGDAPTDPSDPDAQNPGTGAAGGRRGRGRT